MPTIEFTDAQVKTLRMAVDVAAENAEEFVKDAPSAGDQAEEYRSLRELHELQDILPA